MYMEADMLTRLFQPRTGHACLGSNELSNNAERGAYAGIHLCLVSVYHIVAYILIPTAANRPRQMCAKDVKVMDHCGLPVLNLKSLSSIWGKLMKYNSFQLLDDRKLHKGWD